MAHNGDLFGAPPRKQPPSKAAAPRASGTPGEAGYTAASIEVLEGLEPVRRRPGMYIGGTDERALHHLFAEVLDNAMDEAVAGHAKVIEVSLDAGGALGVRDDGRGLPVDAHPKFPGKSALEVIMTVLHSGGKFSGKAYETSGGLHGVGVSVVNALSDRLDVTVWRDGFEWKQSFSRGHPLGPIQQGAPERIHDQTPAEATFHFPNGLADFLKERIGDIETVTPQPFAGKIERTEGGGAVEWAVAGSGAG